MQTINIMIVGVGGQGTLLASRILGKVAIKEGYDVKVSEVHGMSQRGGSVVTYVKYGDKVYSPIIDRGEADLILAFEMLEAMRALPYLKKGGKMIANTQKMNPMPVITGAMEYPENIEEKLSAKINLQAVDALSLAEKAGTITLTARPDALGLRICVSDDGVGIPARQRKLFRKNSLMSILKRLNLDMNFKE